MDVISILGVHIFLLRKEPDINEENKKYDSEANRISLVTSNTSPGQALRIPGG